MRGRRPITRRLRRRGGRSEADGPGLGQRPSEAGARPVAVKPALGRLSAGEIAGADYADPREAPARGCRRQRERANRCVFCAPERVRGVSELVPRRGEGDGDRRARRARAPREGGSEAAPRLRTRLAGSRPAARGAAAGTGSRPARAHAPRRVRWHVVRRHLAARGRRVHPPRARSSTRRCRCRGSSRREGSATPSPPGSWRRRWRGSSPGPWTGLRL